MSAELDKTWARAEDAQKKRHYGTASVLWEMYLRLDPSNTGARVNRVLSLLNSEQAEEALREARLAYNQQPGMQATALALLESLDNCGLAEELKTTADKFTIAFPQLPSPWFRKGKASFLEGEYAHAIEFCQKAVELKNTYCIAWILIGECCMRLRKYKEALHSFGKGLGTFQDYPTPQQAKFDSLIGMGRALAFLNRPDRALVLAEQAEEMNINAAEAQGLKARCKFRMGHPDAVAIAENALRLGHRNDFLEINLACAYTELGRNGEAKQIIERVQPAPNDEGTRHTRAKGLMLIGETEAAIEELESLRDSFDPHIILNSLSSAYRLQGDIQKAETLALEAIASKRDVVTIGNLALLYMQMDSLEEAVPLFEEALNLQPGSPGFLVALGYCYARQGRKTVARDKLLEASESEFASQHVRSRADGMLGRLNNEEEIKQRHKDEGKSLFSIDEVKSYRERERDYRTNKFEVETCRAVSEKLGWSEVKQRKKLSKGEETKTPDVYGIKNLEDKEIVCLGECKMKDRQLVTYSEVSKLLQRIALAADIENDGERRKVRGYFFTNTDYEDDAKELALEHNVTMYCVRISGNPQKSSEWRISSLEEINQCK